MLLRLAVLCEALLVREAEDLRERREMVRLLLSLLHTLGIVSLSPVGFLEVSSPGGGDGAGAAADLPGSPPATWHFCRRDGSDLCLEWMRLTGTVFIWEICEANANPTIHLLVIFLVQDDVCDECGDVGYSHLLLRCSNCNNAARHRYASPSC